MPYVHINIVKDVLKGDVEAKKLKIAQGVVDAICEQAGIAKDLVWVVIQETPNTEWFVGDKAVKQIWKERDERRDS